MLVRRAIAILWWLGVALLIPRLIPLRDEQEKIKTQSARTRYRDPSSRNPDPVIPFDPSRDGGQCAKDEKHRALERRYWHWSIGVGIATATAAGIAAYAARQALEASWQAVRQAHSQTDTAQAAYLASTRPWIKPLVYTTELTIEEESIVASFRITLENIGHSPALRVAAVPVLLRSGYIAANDAERICEAKRFELEIVLFPDGKAPTMFTIASLSSGDFRYDIGEFGNFVPGINLLVCTRYWFNGSNDVHTTGLVFQLSRRLSNDLENGGRGLIDFARKGTIEGSELSLDPSVFGSFAN